MPRILLTYWWSGHEPGDIVDVDDQTARGILGVIARPVEDEDEDTADVEPEPEPESESEPESEPEPEPGR
ncbi:hypothetical protein [Streptomyces sp. NPDC002156]